MDLEPKLYPPWKEAVEKFKGAGFKHGDIITRDWLYDAFGIKKPLPATMSGEECDRLRLRFLSQYEPFKKDILERFMMDLITERGEDCYRIILPTEQTKEAFDDGLQDIRKGLGKMAVRLANVDYAQLTAEQRRENADALARAAMMQGMMRKVRKIPLPTREENKQIE